MAVLAAETMKRRDFLKLAVLALAPLARADELPVGWIFQEWRDPPATVYFIVTDYGPMECDGRALLVSAFPKLFGVLFYSFGGDGDYFNIPDLRWERSPFIDVVDNPTGR